MRQIVLDTETTGLEPELGHRVIELAGVEILNRRATGNKFHRYLNPERESDEAALRVHGLTTEFLQDKPRFADVARDFVEYVADSELIIHNALFDVAFLNHELARLQMKPIGECCALVTDTLKMARELHPGKRNSLDALCERYEVDHSGRTLHGALLDAHLLAEVYLAMTRGQESLIIDLPERSISGALEFSQEKVALIIVWADAGELELHERQLGAIHKASGGACVWNRLLAAPA
jgi:DNA polymerase-3 subunit epsilon